VAFDYYLYDLNLCSNGHLNPGYYTDPQGYRRCLVCKRINAARNYANHREIRKEQVREYHRLVRPQVRLKLLAEMGNRCIQCGFDDVRALQIDHVHGGGSQERSTLTVTQFYSRVREYPEDYQLLCANCNWIKRAENGESNSYGV